MLDIPICSALQEFEGALVCVKAQPVTLTAGLGDLLVRIADIFEIKLPAVVGLVSQVLGFAGNRKNLSSRSPYFLNDTFVNVTP